MAKDAGKDSAGVVTRALLGSLEKPSNREEQFLERRGSSHTPGKGGTLQALGLRDYRFLWFANLFGSIGMWIQMTTLGWLVYDLTGSGTLLGGVNLMRAIPTLLLAPLAGVAADRLDRKKLMVVVQLTVVVGAIVVAMLLALGRIQIWHLFLFTVLAGSSQVFFMPAQQTAVFDIVPRQMIPNAVALNMTAFNSMRVLGPLAAGFLILWLGPSGNFLAQSGAYLAVIVCIGLIAFPPSKTSPQSLRQPLWQSMADGFRYVAKEPMLKMLMMMGFIPALLLIPSFISLMPVFAKDVFKTGPQGLGLLLGASGSGGLLGALIAGSLGKFERRGMLQVVVLIMASTALLIFSFMKTFEIALVFLLIAGFCEMVYMATNQTLLQLAIPDSMRGRITSVFMLNMAAMPLASFLFGTAADLVGAGTVVKMASLVALLWGLAILLFVPRLRNLRLSELTQPKMVNA